MLLCFTNIFIDQILLGTLIMSLSFGVTMIDTVIENSTYSHTMVS